MIREITERQFNAYCYSRQPIVRSYTDEIRWFKGGNLKLLGVIIRDFIDNDFAYVILGRDSRRIFRYIYGDASFKTINEAEEDLRKKLNIYINDENDFYPQYDETKPIYDILKVLVSEEKQHIYFKTLIKEPRFEAARKLIQEIAYSFIDVDGNYLQQFQSDGFDARLWELFLYMYLYNAGFEFNHEHHAPDYCLYKHNYECYIEAVTVGSSPDFDEPNTMSTESIVELSKDYLPIKYGSALYNKLNKAKPYWELKHVKNKPFILAIHDYHKAAEPGVPGSMSWSRAGLSNYLYGRRDDVYIDKKNLVKSVLQAPYVNPQPKIIKIKRHKFKHKDIPSNFFELPNSEHISAVLFSNGATLSTFNRMGRLAGFGSSDVKMTRTGMRRSPLEDLAFTPFLDDIDDLDYEEAWGDSIVMYHNPNALYPVDPDMFSDISHVLYDKEHDRFLDIINPNEVFSSITIIVQKEKKKKEVS